MGIGEQYRKPGVVEAGHDIGFKIISDTKVIFFDIPSVKKDSS